MKLTLILAGLLTMSGCATLMTTNAFVNDEEALVDPNLAGTWTQEDDTIVVRLNGKAYEVTYIDSGRDATKFTGRLGRFGGALVMDLARDTDDPFVMALHFALRVWPEPGTLRWTFLDTEWAKQQAAGGIRNGDRTIVPGELLRRLAADDRAHGKIEIWTRAQ